MNVYDSSDVAKPLVPQFDELIIVNGGDIEPSLTFSDELRLVSLSDTLSECEPLL